MKNKLKTFVSISITIIFFLCLHYIGWLIPVENFFRNIITPSSQFIYSITVSLEENKEEFASLDELRQAYQNTKKELLKNKVDEVQMELLKQENEELKKQLNFLSAGDYNNVGVQVLGKNIDPVGNTLVVNRGSSDGIGIGNAVISGEGILIGKIVKVEENLSIIRLINDNQSKIAATIVNQDKSIGLVEGGYGISVHMNFIPQNETIVVGDLVITSGLENDIPRGLLLGKIEAVEKEAYQPFQRAIISPLVNLNKITEASVIIPIE
ncbi:MAG: rod shape-determining protein MreC [Candidatus Magasanikbacteria bacterium]